MPRENTTDAPGPPPPQVGSDSTFEVGSDSTCGGRPKYGAVPDSGGRESGTVVANAFQFCAPRLPVAAVCRSLESFLLRQLYLHTVGVTVHGARQCDPECADTPARARGGALPLQ